MKEKIHPPPLLRKLPKIARSLAVCCILFFCCSYVAMAQFTYNTYLWVVPIDPSAYPINNTTTGNAKLNKIFEEYYVEEYKFLNYIFVEYTQSIEPICEIRIKYDYFYLIEDLCQTLKDSCSSLFKIFLWPYEFRSVASFWIFLIDPSARPCSPIHSCNEQVNTLLERYNVLGYTLPFKDSSIPSARCILLIECGYTDLISFYYDLCSLNHLFDDVTLGLGRGCLSSDKSNIFDIDEEAPIDDSYPNYLLKKGYPPCEVGVFDLELESVTVSPNPAHNYLNISGISPHQITLYDWQGRVVLAQTEPTNRINISHLQRGLYFLHIISDTGMVFVQKIIKE